VHQNSESDERYLIFCRRLSCDGIDSHFWEEWGGNLQGAKNASIDKLGA